MLVAARMPARTSGSTTFGSGVPGGGQCTARTRRYEVRPEQHAEERRLGGDEADHAPPAVRARGAGTCGDDGFRHSGSGSGSASATPEREPCQPCERDGCDVVRQQHEHEEERHADAR